jgi:hypothetical protein
MAQSCEAANSATASQLVNGPPTQESKFGQYLFSN